MEKEGSTIALSSGKDGEGRVYQSIEPDPSSSLVGKEEEGERVCMLCSPLDHYYSIVENKKNPFSVRILYYFLLQEEPISGLHYHIHYYHEAL